MSDQVRRSLFMMLRDMLGHNEDLIRSIAAACLACLMRWLSTEQLNVILTEHLLGTTYVFVFTKRYCARNTLRVFVSVDDPSIDTALKYGRSTALFVALKENAKYVYVGNYCEKINKTLISHLQSSKVR